MFRRRLISRQPLRSQKKGQQAELATEGGGETYSIAESFCNSWSLGWIRIQQCFNELLRLRRHVLPVPLVELNLGLRRLADKFFVVFGTEGGVAA
jgi:hypothetical protein